MKKEKTVKKVAKKAVSKSIMNGALREGTAVCNIFHELEDGRWHKISGLKSVLDDKSVNIGRRLYNLNWKGRKSNQWELEKADGKVKLTMGRPKKGAEKAEPKGKKGGKKHSKPHHEEEEDDRPAKKSAKASKPGRASVQDVPTDED
jgi:hypothetical protein